MAVTDTAFYRQLGQRIAERRKALGMNQAQLADLFGISQQTMAKHETGTLRVAISMLPTLSEALGVSIEERIGVGVGVGVGVGAKRIAKSAAKKRGPTTRIQQQLEAASALPRAKQRMVRQVLDSMLAQANHKHDNAQREGVGRCWIGGDRTA